MADYTPSPECIATPEQIRRWRAKAEMADWLVPALATALLGYLSSYPDGYIICKRCGGRDQHRDWCDMPKWEALLAEYDALEATP